MSKNEFEDIKSAVSKFGSVKSALPDLSSITAPVRDITKGFAEMQKSIVDNPAIKQLSETLASIHKSCVFDVAEKIQNISARFAKPLHTFFESESLKNLIKGYKYLDVLEKSEWSLFHIQFENAENILSLKKEDFFPFLLSFYENEYEKILVESWKNAPIVRYDRKPILEEALALFDNHFYYGVSSILMCQLYGIAEDIDLYSKKHSLKISPEDVDGIDELYETTPQKGKEKRRLFQKLMHVQERVTLWNRTLQYINNYVLKNPQKPINELTVPHRNKICHGEQLNFGTQEHALKAIFIIDSLISFSNEIYSSTQDM